MQLVVSYLFLLLALTQIISFPISAQETLPKDPSSRIFCQVRKDLTTIYFQNCPFIDQVMTGIVSLDPVRVKCARLTVDCYNQKGEEIPTQTNFSLPTYLRTTKSFD